MSAAQLIAAVIAAFVVTQAAIFATTIYLHRGLTHRALSVHPALAYPSRVLIWLTTGMRPREWVAVHRKHHAATDTAEDPHSPKVLGFWRVQLGNVGLYKRAASDRELVRKYARDIPRDELDRYAFDHALLGLAIGISILVTVMWARKVRDRADATKIYEMTWFDVFRLDAKSGLIAEHWDSSERWDASGRPPGAEFFP